jgi:hypothetical protein
MPPEAGKAAGKGSAGGPAATGTKVTEADLVADAPSEYTVVKGDTLWGIAGRFLKDPWKWPHIWQMNQDQIKNPHLIYPGDVVRLDREALRLSIASGGRAAPPAAWAARRSRRPPTWSSWIRACASSPCKTAIPSIPGSVIGPFLSQPLVVEIGGMDNAPTILATEESRVIIGAGDTAYADRIGTDDGVNWQVFRQGMPLKDPDSGEVLGYEAKYVGDARVQRFGNPTTLYITKARQEINRGDRLTPAREATYPTYIPRAPTSRSSGSIMSVDGGVSEFGQYQIMTINRGARDGIEVGPCARRLSTRPGSRRQRPRDLVERPALVLEPRRILQQALPGRSRPAQRRPATTAQSEGKVVGVAQAGSVVMLPDERTGLVFVFRVFDKLSYGW